MALKIGEYVIAGELRNTRRNSVFGWIEFAPDYGIGLDLTGNLDDELAGKHIRFVTPKRSSPENREPNQELSESDEEEFPEEVECLADRQIGVMGTVRVSRRWIPDIPVTEFAKLASEKQKDHLREEVLLVLEWFSQNGRVIAEITGAEIEFVSDEDEALEHVEHDDNAEDEDIPFDDSGLDEENVFDEDSEDEEHDPFGLFSSDLENHVADSLSELPQDPEEAANVLDQSASRDWDEIIPGLDPEIKAMYEQWDEIFEGKDDRPIGELLEEPLRLPVLRNVNSDDEAKPHVQAILAQLAKLSVAINVCEHFSPLETYALLIQEILPTAKVHPKLADNDMVACYSTSDYCKTCKEEFEAESNKDDQELNEDYPDSDSDE